MKSIPRRSTVARAMALISLPICGFIWVKENRLLNQSAQDVCRRVVVADSSRLLATGNYRSDTMHVVIERLSSSRKSRYTATISADVSVSYQFHSGRCGPISETLTFAMVRMDDGSWKDTPLEGVPTMSAGAIAAIGPLAERLATDGGSDAPYRAVQMAQRLQAVNKR